MRESDGIVATALTPTAAPTPASDSNILLHSRQVMSRWQLHDDENSGPIMAKVPWLPDPDYERAFRDARLSSRGWDTDFQLPHRSLQ